MSATFLDTQILSLENFSKDKDKWNFINEAQKSQKDNNYNKLLKK